MPGGTITIDARNTYAAAIFMGATAKTIYGTDEPDISRDGQRKYAADVAVTYLAEPGRKPVSEVISVSILGTDPAASVPAGSAVEFDRLRCGVSQAERNDRGGVRGGRLYFMADGIRSAASPNGSRPLASSGAKSE
jgi:hypothetical protein